MEDGVAQNSTSSSGIAIDNQGKIDVSGYTLQHTLPNGIDGNLMIGTQDLFLTQYNSSGIRQWTVEDGASGDTANGLDVVTDPSSNIYMFGATNKGLDGNSLIGTYDYFISQYSSGGVRE